MSPSALFTIFGIVLFANILFIDCADATEATEAKKSNSTTTTDKKPSQLVHYIANEVSWRNDLEKPLVIAGLLICGVALIGAFAWLLAPILGYKMCHIFGNCETEVVPYSNYAGTLQDFAQPNAYPNIYANSYDSSYTGRNYRKRSLDRLVPIIKTLASAYEKFDQPSNAASQ